MSSGPAPLQQQARALSVSDGPHSSQVIAVRDRSDGESLREFVQKPVDPKYVSQWVYCPLKCASAMEGLEDHGFSFHHASNHTGVLYRWLGKGESKVPDYATHRVGVAGLVVRPDNGKVLLVKEKRGKYWKLPGGHADLGEDVFATAVREVSEETGVACEFEHILGLRQSHSMAHGRSDFYFICQLRPLTTDLRPCPDEISDAGWFDISVLGESKSELNCTVARLFAEKQFQPIQHLQHTHLITKLPAFFYYSKPMDEQ